MPWQTPQAQLLSQAAAAAAASLGGGGGGGGGGALGGDSAGGSLVPGLAPGLDALWPLDGNGWPPPLEGSLAHLDAAHDPSNPAATDFLRTPPMRCCVIADCGLIRHRGRNLLFFFVVYVFVFVDVIVVAAVGVWPSLVYLLLVCVLLLAAVAKEH